MGERKGQNKYYPPDFDYKVHKSLAGYHGQHPLRERARKMDQGILIIRFEMPYNIWCDGCNNHIGMGVRYNAEKSKDGMYYTTPIYKFRMKCHLCDNHFEIKTDPANHDYVIISGARRKEQRWDPHENEQIVPEDRATQKQLALNAMYKLEHGEEDRTKGQLKQSTISQILEHRESHKDDFALNQLARKQFRETKKSVKAEQLKDDSFTKKYGLDIKLLKEHPDDVRASKLLKFSTTEAVKDPPPSSSRLIFSSKSSNSSSTVSPLTKKDISLKRLKQIATSEVTRKRSEAFFGSPADGASSAEKGLSRVIVHRRRKSESIGDCSTTSHETDNISRCEEEVESESKLAATRPGLAEKVTSDCSSKVVNSALGILCSDYTSYTDDDDDEDNS